MNTLRDEIAAIPVKRKLKIEHQNAKQKALIDKANNILLDANESDIAFLKERGYVKPLVRPVAFSSNEYLTENDIKKLATSYRLRFLPIERFRSDLPYEAIVKMREAEEKHKGFKGHYNEQRKFVDTPAYYILAPYSAFELEERPKDPILFLQVERDTFLPVHSWGKDMTILRKILVLPLRNMLFTGLILLAINVFLSITFHQFLPLFVFSLFTSVGLMVGTVATIKWDSALNWDSRYKLRFFDA